VRPDWVTQDENPLMSADHFQDKLVDELGDALFYLTRVALDAGKTLEEIMFRQDRKLVDQSSKYKRTFLK